MPFSARNWASATALKPLLSISSSVRYNVVKSMDKLFDELFIHPFIGGGHRDEQNNNEQK